MPALLVTALIIVAASVATGLVLFALLGEKRPTPLAGAVGFAALVIACPLLIRLPGRATTAAVVVLVALVAGAWWARARFDLAERPRGTVATALALLVLGCLPFAFNNQVGVLGEGIYTNDQAAQLYWTDWLQHGFGPEPKAVQFGYPTGPQALTATAAEPTGVDLDDAFNGLLVAIAVLAAMAALAALADLTPVRRVVAAVLIGMPYLAASFLAQSAFKETAMALFVLAFAVALERRSATALGVRARVAALLILAGGAFFTYSVPGLVWFAATLGVWLVLEVLLGGLRLPLDEVRDAARSHRRLVAVFAVVALAVVVLGAAQGANFVSKIGNVQQSAGRLSSPVWPGEALGIWPEGDFRIVRGEVNGAYLATLVGLAVTLAGAWLLWLRRRYAALAALGSAAAIYVGARAFASIYVQAKALAVMAPLVALVALGGLLALPTEGEGRRGLPPGLRFGLGLVAAVGFALSTLLALRAAPVGFPDRGEQLEGLASRIDSHSVVFLGVDRFAAYWLRDTLIQSPGGYVPPEIRARPEKVWQQGRPLDLDTLDPAKLDHFKYAVTTNAGFQSSPPPNLEEVDHTDSYVLWRRHGKTPRQRVLNEDGDPGKTLHCFPHRHGPPLGGPGAQATVLTEPVVGGVEDWSIASPFEAPATASQKLELRPGSWGLSLQYASQVPITVETGGSSVELPPSLDGMYLTHQGEGAFWEAGTVESTGAGPTTVTVTAAEPNTLQRALGVDRKVWLGRVAATLGGPRKTSTGGACGNYVDHYVPASRG